jgi:hypothetical protein
MIGFSGFITRINTDDQKRRRKRGKGGKEVGGGSRGVSGKKGLEKEGFLERIPINREGSGSSPIGGKIGNIIH